MNRSKVVVALLAVGLYLISAGASYLFFAKTSLGSVSLSGVPTAQVGENGKVTFDDSLPKTEVCPLNGAMYSKQQEQWWEKHGPLGVMIENHTEARPQSGLSSADVVYEAVAEGGITRFLAMYYCQDAGNVGPVRSARTYFIDFASEYGDFPLYAHVGGANQPGPADAISQLGDYDWAGYNDLNQFSVPYTLKTPTFYRDQNRLGNVAQEHTMYSKLYALWDYAATSRDLTNVDKDGNKWNKEFVPYKFSEDALSSARPSAQSVQLEFWESAGNSYVVDWVYDPKTNSYKRSNGGSAHLDLNTKKQIAAKNVVVLLMQELNANDGYENNVHLLYKDKGTGKAIVFKDGKRINGTWEKDSRTDRTILTDSSGIEIKFNRGLIWFEILPTDGVVNVK